MFVLLIDLLMFMVLLLFVHTLSATKWSLCRLEGIASEIGHSDPAQWWAGMRKTGNMVIVDSGMFRDLPDSAARAGDARLEGIFRGRCCGICIAVGDSVLG